MSKWLLRKASGSRAKFKETGDFSSRRGGKFSNFEDLPTKESMQGKNSKKTYLDTTLVNRWLQSKINQDFDEVYSEFLTRIQPKYLDAYRNCIYEYLEPRKSVVIDGKTILGTFNDAKIKLPNGKKKFYVDPESNKIKKA
ncbi:hypothetical protein BXQ17_06175 [Polaribacter sp. BM10]|uniref:hypothetical protein n=1 Tax=Polaribacter sp. BM10 TaxID=1529069 RepID=UPI00098B78FA|nr:hypothetical protein [Polaribacter sp. BM10]AQS93666.1 hypothetical protein BXQ17_06175 [Polaribacter sp. BM10]